MKRFIVPVDFVVNAETVDKARQSVLRLTERLRDQCLAVDVNDAEDISDEE